VLAGPAPLGCFTSFRFPRFFFFFFFCALYVDPQLWPTVITFKRARARRPSRRGGLPPKRVFIFLIFQFRTFALFFSPKRRRRHGCPAGGPIREDPWARLLLLVTTGLPACVAAVFYGPKNTRVVSVRFVFYQYYIIIYRVPNRNVFNRRIYYTVVVVSSAQQRNNFVEKLVFLEFLSIFPS